MRDRIRRPAHLVALGTVLVLGPGSLPPALQAAPPEYLSAEQPAGHSLPDHYGWDTTNTFYAEASWLRPLNRGLDLKLSVQFTDQRSVGDALLGDFAELGLEGFSAFSTIVFGDTPDAGGNASPDQNEYDLTIDYRIEEGPLKNLWLRGRAAYIDGDDRNRKDYRLIVNYTFPF